MRQAVDEQASLHLAIFELANRIEKIIRAAQEEPTEDRIRRVEECVREVRDSITFFQGEFRISLRKLQQEIERIAGEIRIRGPLKEPERKRVLRRLLEKMIEAVCLVSRGTLTYVAHSRPELPSPWKLKEIRAKLITRGLVGAQLLPWKAVFGMGMFWDPVLQLPYYPASSVKGAVHGLLFCPELVREAVGRALGRDFGLEEALARALVLFGVSNWKEDVASILENKDINLDELAEGVKRVMDERGAALPDDRDQWVWSGTVIFFDAYPTESGYDGWLLIPEVITPHYKEEPKKLGEHEVKPVPVQWLAVERGAVFTFPLASINDEDLGIAGELLTTSLKTIGIGAKTMSGYNLFEVVAGAA